MTQTLHVGRMKVRYRVSHDDVEVRRRLDDLLDAVLGEGLEPALARAGVPADEEMCIRFVRAPARLRLEAGQAAAAAEWSAAIADAVAAALTAPRRDVVRYRSRRAALVDLALGIAAGDYDRCWAWRQLGLWDGPDPTNDAAAVAGLVRALIAEPEAVVAVLAETARAGTLSRLATQVDSEAWIALARAALSASGATRPVLEAVAESTAAGDVDTADRRGLRERARAIVVGSRLARAFAASSPGHADARAAAYAALAWLDAEPGAPAATTVAAARDLVAAVAAEFVDEASLAAVASMRDPQDEERATTPSSDRARRQTTRFGGLLFLLGLLDQLALPATLQTVMPLAARPLEWTLHRLALAITPAKPDDPGALAFAGLAPESPPPDGDPISGEELVAINDVAGTLAEHVRTRLARPDTPPRELLDLVCRRRGEILFDPGWIELRLATEEISVELRRAGLDLDPGWLPWLGAVVRFAYV
jgi:hypothetical protein